MTVGAPTLRGAVASSTRRLAIEYEMIGPTVMALDCILLLALAPLATIVLPWLNAAHSGNFGRSAAVSAVFCGLIVPMFSLRGIYNPSTLSNFPRQLRTIVLVCAFSFALMIFVAAQLDISPQTTRFRGDEFHRRARAADAASYVVVDPAAARCEIRRDPPRRNRPGHRRRPGRGGAAFAP